MQRRSVCMQRQMPTGSQPKRTRIQDLHIYLSLYRQLLFNKALHPPLHRIQILGRSNVILASSLPARKSQILRHNAINIHRLNASLLERFRKCHKLWCIIQNSSLDKSSCPSEDGGDWVGGCLVSFLMLPVMASDGSVGGFGFERLSIWGDENGCHET